MPDTVARRVYDEHKAFYDKLQLDVAKAAAKVVVDPRCRARPGRRRGAGDRPRRPLQAGGRADLGCQDNQTSMDGDHNGAFTEQLLKAWNHGTFTGSYGSFHAHIRAAMPPTQSPNLFVLGDAAAFLAQTPFTV